MTSVKRVIRATALALAAGAAVAGAGEARFDAAGGSVYVTWSDGTRTIDYVHTPGAPWTALEVLSKPGAPPLLGVSHSANGVVVHAGAAGSGTLTSALFRAGGTPVPNAPYALRDLRTGQITQPVAVRTIALDPGEPPPVRLDASHVSRPTQLRAVVVVQRASGEVLLVDHDFNGGPVRRTPLGFTPPIGSNKGSFVAAPDGRVWVAFASSGGIRLFDVGDVSAPGALQPDPRGILAAGAGFDPGSTRLGIIAILIGLVAQPVPSLSYQSGDELFVSAYDGSGFRPVARQPVPAGAQGFMEDDGIWYYLLPYIEQENLYKAYRDSIVEPVLELGR